MNQNDRLRALLTEARRELGTIEALLVHPDFHNGPGGDAFPDLLSRIDSILAETPVENAISKRWAEISGKMPPESRPGVIFGERQCASCVNSNAALECKACSGSGWVKAEPLSPEQQIEAWQSVATKLLEEKDAELRERLRLYEHNIKLERHNKELRESRDQVWSICAKAIGDAYERGAEAMRRAAAEACAPLLRSLVSRSSLANQIMALPIPEDTQK